MPVWYLVPDGVVQYIEKRGLYREGRRRAASDHGSSNASEGAAALWTGPTAGQTPPRPEPSVPGSTPTPDSQEVPR
jgi:nicotinate-nucleotide adenylyltransferase